MDEERLKRRKEKEAMIIEYLSFDGSEEGIIDSLSVLCRVISIILVVGSFDDENFDEMLKVVIAYILRAKEGVLNTDGYKALKLVQKLMQTNSTEK